MLEQARAKAAAQGFAAMNFIEASADSLPFADASFDIAVSGFVLRSLARIRAGAARELYRVLKPGGSACLLELTRPRLPGLRQLHQAYLRAALPAITHVNGSARVQTVSF
jgi:demethylmenaquinone methyltransferase/2-methoxy-6-polyprenyl-1,4-benzoquinol methylase